MWPSKQPILKGEFQRFFFLNIPPRYGFPLQSAKSEYYEKFKDISQK